MEKNVNMLIEESAHANAIGDYQTVSHYIVYYIVREGGQVERGGNT